MTEDTKDEFELEYFEEDDGTDDGAWKWKVTSPGNHEVIIASDEGFDSKSNAKRNFELVQRAFLSL